jgi:hypothetical protein
MKTKLIVSFFCLLSVYCLLNTAYCFSAVPNLINYQGVLKDSTGVPVDNDVIMVFSIWDDSTNGSKLWEELQSIVHVNHGLFNVLLGGSTPIASAMFDGIVRYLQVQVNTSVLQPRRRLVSVGYASHSEYADTAEYARVTNAVAWRHSGQQVYSGTGYNDWATLDLSSYVGSNYAFVVLKLYSSETCQLIVRPHGDPHEYQKNTDFGDYSANAVKKQGMEAAIVVCETDSSGKIDFKTGGTVSNLTITLLGYIK